MNRTKYDELLIERPPSLTEVAVSKLSSAILSGLFDPGQRLLEVEVSNGLQISRGPLREALRALANEGLVTIHQNRGAYVASPSDEEIEQLAIFRALIEGSAARLVAGARDPAALGRLREIATNQKKALDASDNVDFHEQHWNFHRSICIESNNKFLVQAFKSVSSLIRIYHRIIAVDLQRMMKNNEVFLDALCRLDPEEAEQIVRGEVLRVAFLTLNRPIPSTVAGYVTRLIGPDGTVTRI
jgi:DNA-binding GntR family transcriptional regulator